MALRFMDGFAHYSIPSQLGYKYTEYSSSYTSTMTGRRSDTTTIRMNSKNDYISKTLDDQSTWIVGFAFYWTTPSSSGYYPFLTFIDAAGDTQLQVKIYDGIIRIYRGSTYLKGSTTTLSPKNWVYIEVKAVIDDTDGVFEVRVNGSVVLTYSGNTQDSSSYSTAREIRLSGLDYAYTAFQDLYICDGTGDLNNTYLGDVRVDTLMPSGAGTTTDFTPTGSDNNYENVDEASIDSDTSYNASNTVGAIDSFSFDTLEDMGSTIKGLQLNLFAKKDDSGDRTMKAITRLSDTNYEGDEETITDSYVNHRQIWEQNPATSEEWDEDTINGAEFGYEVAS